jgi:4-amino-4-deoxy-L-arabinose transferase-like glycosyltransferase
VVYAFPFLVPTAAEASGIRAVSRGLILFAAIALLWFVNLEYLALLRPDEGRYAEIAREMLASGDWLTPRLNDVLYFEKPPLQYWATALIFAVFGLDEWTARLWTALTGFAGLALVCALGTRLYGALAGRYATVVLASATLYGALGHINTLDMSFTLFVNAALACFFVAETGAGHRGRWIAGAWLAIAAAVLSKGLVGLVLPVGVLAAYTVVKREWGLPRRLVSVPALLLFAAVAVPWFVAMSVRHPEFARFFFLHEHFDRFVSTGHHRTGPPWYYVPVLAAGIVPWLAFLPGALRDAWYRARSRKKGFDADLALLCACLVPFVFFSIAQSKLVTYILPVFPALAILIARRLDALSAERLTAHLLVTLVGAALLLLLALLVPARLPVDVPPEMQELYLPWVVLAALSLVLLTALSLNLAMQRQAVAAVVALGIAGVAFYQLGLAGYQTLSSAVSAEELGERLEPQVPRDAAVYAIDYLDAGLPFYLRRPVTLVKHAGELDFGLGIEPQKWVPDEAQFVARWLEHDVAYAAMRRKTYERLRAEGLPMTVVDQDHYAVFVKRPERSDHAGELARGSQSKSTSSPIRSTR